MVTKEELKKYANLLLFDMKDSEYDTLLKEFEIIENQMNLINKIENIEVLTPMTFPHDKFLNDLKYTIPVNGLEIDKILLNAKNTKDNQVIVPKVVE